MEPQVKGVWFVTGRRLLLRDYGEAKLQAVARAMPHPEVLLEPLPSLWYPEDRFQEALRATMELVAHHDGDAFERFIEDCTLLGVNTFFRVLLRLPSPAFLMRQLPALSRQYRRNDWVCTVQANDERATVRWTGVPYLSDRNYRHYMVAQMVKICQMCTGVRPRCEILSYGADHATAQVTY